MRSFMSLFKKPIKNGTSVIDVYVNKKPGLFYGWLSGK